MEAFAILLDRLVLTPQRNGKLRLISDYFAETPDPDRGYALAALAGALDIGSVKASTLRTLTTERVDETLFRLSYDYVGDLAETISLIWPGKRGANRTPPLGEIVTTLQTASRREGPAIVARWLDAMTPTQRWALIKLLTGGLRIGVSARLAKQALAQFGDKQVQEIEELWHGIEPPYKTLFAWLEGRSEKPEPQSAALFRPVMLAHPLGDGDLAALAPAEFVAEWKWDGVRVQAVSEGGVRRLYSRSGDDISAAFPDIVEALDFDGAVDGELLIFDPDMDAYAVRPFSDLQSRLNRKSASKPLLRSHPAFIYAYDLLAADGKDLRNLPFETRRARLELLVGNTVPRMALSPLVPFVDAEDLASLRADPPHDAIEGLMLKRRAAPYIPGRPKGEWWKWKREPHLIDAVMMYAQRGHGKRSSFYSDFTFGVWTGADGEETLTPVGKAYFGFTDEELKELDRFVRNNTTDRFGPVRQVRASRDGGLVLEIAFEGLNRSTRHKSGVAMRFPRINRIRWDKPAIEADRLETLEMLLPETAPPG